MSFQSSSPEGQKPDNAGAHAAGNSDAAPDQTTTYNEAQAEQPPAAELIHTTAIGLVADDDRALLKYVKWANGGMLWHAGDDITHGHYEKFEDRRDEARMPKSNLFDVFAFSGEASIYERFEIRKFFARALATAEKRLVTVALISGAPVSEISNR